MRDDPTPTSPPPATATLDFRDAEKVLPLVYAELRHLAASRMAREAPGHTLQPTALVHEAWLRLGADAQPIWQNRAHFFGAAAEAMRRILIERARRRKRVRHGGELERVTPDALDSVAAPAVQDDDLLAVHEALEKFAAIEPKKAELVKLRYFTGMTLEDAAAALDVPLGTAKHWWAYARAWLFREIARPIDPL